MSDTPTMHIDGAARGNPGPAAYAVVLNRPGHPPVEEAQTIGTATNNVAEYTALVRGLELASALGLKRLAVFSDSELLVKQMNGEYRVKHPDLLPLYEEASRLRRGFDALSITHVRRAQNARADALCNVALDGQRKKREAATEKPSAPRSPQVTTSDAAVRDDAIAVLLSAAQAWASHGLGAVPVQAVWEQLWSILEEGGVLKTKKAK
ncbi:MAG TPA: ribonuclease HI family protein [Gemmataceae bacterium]|nr:ribonuclease HI family protein [Gemmataceae bacterium]